MRYSAATAFLACGMWTPLALAQSCAEIPGSVSCPAGQDLSLAGTLEVDASVFTDPSVPVDALTVTTGSGGLDRGIVVNAREGSLSGLDIAKNQQSGNYARFLGLDGRPITQIADGGQIETVAWVTISGTVQDVGPNRRFLAPTDRPYMLGVWADVFGPAAVFRANGYGAPTGEAWPISIISGSGRERLRIDDAGDILLGDISGNDVEGERLQLRLGRSGDTGLLVQANAGGSPAHILVEKQGWFGAIDNAGAEVRLLGMSGTSIRLGNGTNGLEFAAPTVRLQGSLILGTVDTNVVAPTGSIGFCQSCAPGSGIVYSDGARWLALGGTDAQARDLANAALNQAKSAGEAASLAGTTALAAKSVADENAASLTAFATGAHPLAAQASGEGSLAVGNGATATGAISSALGDKAAASGYGASAVGAGAQATGYQATALGEFARALGDRSAAVGRAAAATGNRSFAGGTIADASGADSLALGAMAAAKATGAAAVGAQSSASAANSTAVGFGARASQAGSTAVGAGATTTAANQVTLGGAGTSVRLGDLAASTAAQNGPTYTVTVDEQGTLGRQQVITTASLNRVQTELISALSVTDQQFADLSGRVDVLNTRLDSMQKETRAGVAAAMALGGTMVVPDSAVSVSFNVATYRGQQGFSGALVARVADKVYLSSGFAGSTAAKSTGGRVGLALGF